MMNGIVNDVNSTYCTIGFLYVGGGGGGKSRLRRENNENCGGGGGK